MYRWGGRDDTKISPGSVRLQNAAPVGESCEGAFV